MFAKTVARHWMNKIEAGSLHVHFPDKSSYRVTGLKPGPTARLTIHSWRFVRRVVLAGELALAEGFMDGDWSTDTLAELIELGAKNNGVLRPNPAFAVFSDFLGWLAHRRNANTLSGSKRNISFHYDLGNNFYGSWLDPSMTYSSALFEDGVKDMSAAQIHKYRALADSIDLKPGDRVLEVGCGWGGFAEVAARDYGATVIGLTLSEEQAAYARARMERLGLSHRVDIRLQDYRQVRGEFDKLVSIEMFEAVGEENWPDYFRMLNDRLAPGGSAALQIITIDEGAFKRYRRRIDFIQRYIFPGGMLPSSEALTREISRQGLILTGMRYFGSSYAETLRIWRHRFLSAWPSIAKLGFDGRFKRMWIYYLGYCEGGFRAGRINVGHFTLRKA